MIYQGEGLLAYLQAEEVSLTRVVMRSLSLVGWLIVEIGYITVLRNGRK